MRRAAQLLAGVIASLFGCAQKPTPAILPEKYFIRAATYDVVDGALVITDPNRPRIVTVDPFPEIIFAAATGERTVGEFVDQLREQWGPEAPQNLSSQVEDQLRRLVDEGLVQVIDAPRKLTAYLARPTSEQDPDEMRRQMLADGFIRE